jgi:hypothetical protein
MNKIMLSILMAAAALLSAACTPTANAPAGNSANANSNAAANRSIAEAPSKDALLAMKKSAFEAWKNKDTKFWDSYVSDKFEGISAQGILDKAAVLKHFAATDCEVKSYAIDDEQMTTLGNDAALITYKASADAVCGGEKVPEAWVATIFAREGDKWKAVFHGEALMTDPNKPAAPPPPTTIERAPASSASPAASASPSTHPTVDAMFALEKKAWEAWMQKDAKTIEAWASPDLLAFTQNSRKDRAGAVKGWMEDGCKVNSVKLTEPSGTMFGTDHGILLFHASVDGECGGSPVPAEYGATVYRKEGGDWKALFTMGTPEM